MTIALCQFVCTFERLVVLVLDAERLANVVDAILIGRRVVAARRLVPY